MQGELKGEPDIYIYIYIYIHTFTHTHTHRRASYTCPRHFDPECRVNLKGEPDIYMYTLTNTHTYLYIVGPRISSLAILILNAG